MKRSVVVTGASTGIGFAVAKMAAAQGFHVFAGVRKMADADRIASDIGDEATPILFDVADSKGVTEAAREVAGRLGTTTLAGLVNNAGIATAGPLLHQPLDEIRNLFEVNVLGQIATIQAFAPLLGADRARSGPPGRIVNMSSVAGRLALPFFGAYAASKHALEALSDSLRRELTLYGIEVVVIEPGVIATPIWDKAEKIDASPYMTTDYAPYAERLRSTVPKEGRAGLPPERVAAAVLRALTVVNPPARIPVIQNKFAKWILPRLLPDKALDGVLTRMFGLKRKA